MRLLGSRKVTLTKLNEESLYNIVSVTYKLLLYNLPTATLQDYHSGMKF